MKKLFAKDKENRQATKQLELKHFVLKQICNVTVVWSWPKQFNSNYELALNVENE